VFAAVDGTFDAAVLGCVGLAWDFDTQRPAVGAAYGRPSRRVFLKYVSSSLIEIAAGIGGVANHHDGRVSVDTYDDTNPRVQRTAGFGGELFDHGPHQGSMVGTCVPSLALSLNRVLELRERRGRTLDAETKQHRAQFCEYRVGRDRAMSARPTMSSAWEGVGL
jgi:hypothetical protein